MPSVVARKGDNRTFKVQHYCSALSLCQLYGYVDSVTKLQGSLPNTCLVNIFSNVSRFGMYMFDSADSSYGQQRSLQTAFSVCFRPMSFCERPGTV